jgi:hypothetical protein
MEKAKAKGKRRTQDAGLALVVFDSAFALSLACQKEPAPPLFWAWCAWLFLSLANSLGKLGKSGRSSAPRVYVHYFIRGSFTVQSELLPFAIQMT